MSTTADYSPMPVDELDFSKLDPGIRDVVKHVIAFGFTTTDSGDGLSKNFDEYPEAIPFPHIVAQIKSKAEFFSEANRLMWVLRELNPKWSIEATYYPTSEQMILFASLPEPTASSFNG